MAKKHRLLKHLSEVEIDEFGGIVNACTCIWTVDGKYYKEKQHERCLDFSAEDWFEELQKMIEVL